MARRKMPARVWDARNFTSLNSYGSGEADYYRRLGDTRPRSRTRLRALMVEGIRVSRGAVQQNARHGGKWGTGQKLTSLIGFANNAATQPRSKRNLANAAYRAGLNRGFASRGVNTGRNLGSFKNRSGQWKKGKGGRFVGSA